MRLDTFNWTDLDTVARTIAGEARGESREGKVAVAHVIVNRTIAQHRRATSMAAVCLDPWQFSCWNPDDPNLRKLQRLPVNHGAYVNGLRALLVALLGIDTTAGSTHYFNPQVAGPEWAYGLEPARVIGRHWFYNNVP